MAKLDVRIKESGKDSLQIELGGRSRLLYLVIFILLSLTVFFSIDPAQDFSSSRIGGTIFTFVLILLSLAVTVVVRSVSIDKSSGLVEKRIGLPFGLYSRATKTYVMGSRPQLLINSISGLYPETGMKGARMSGKGKMSLSIETAEDTVLICEGVSKDEISSVGQYLSHYLGYPLK